MSETSSGVYKTIQSTDVKQAGFGVTTVIAIVSTCVGMGVTWGAYSNRLAEVERKADDAQKAAIGTQISMATSQAQYIEIIRRLDRIERQGK
jgi:hypothetical protein